MKNAYLWEKKTSKFQDKQKNVAQMLEKRGVALLGFVSWYKY